MQGPRGMENIQQSFAESPENRLATVESPRLSPRRDGGIKELVNGFDAFRATNKSERD
jgi:hypothetical protein